MHHVPPSKAGRLTTCRRAPLSPESLRPVGRLKGSTLSNKKKVKAKKPEKDDPTIPVWLQATESFYRKLNRVAKQCGMSRYEALSRGLDALRREREREQSPLNKTVRASQAEVFRKTLGAVSREFWSKLTPEEKRKRAQNSANARWAKERRKDQG